ncbi:helix-turn-helix transcriptional regulator [Nocardioides sp.]|uniref:helix-turn-helix transcriptional regulator n=1 Tax=Nocardioides sp. TaxID=35761 RepID=UPI003D0DE279
MNGPRTPNGGVRIPVEHYERVLAVLEQCDAAETLEEFKELVLESLASVFSYRHLTCFSGPTVKQAFGDRAPSLRGSCAVSWPGYRDQWHKLDVLSSPESCANLERDGFSDLRGLSRVPDWGREYIDGHMRAWGYRSSAVIHLEFPQGGHALVGLTDPDPDLIDDVDAATLRVLSRNLSAISRRLATSRVEERMPDSLSDRLHEVASLVCAGQSNREIAEGLYLSLDTVKKYVSRILATTGCRSRAELVARYRPPTRRIRQDMGGEVRASRP